MSLSSRLFARKQPKPVAERAPSINQASAPLAKKSSANKREQALELARQHGIEVMSTMDNKHFDIGGHKVCRGVFGNGWVIRNLDVHKEYKTAAAAISECVRLILEARTA